MRRLRRLRRAATLAVAGLALALVAAGCGGGRRGLVVSAATSLKSALTSYGHQFSPGPVRFSFAGSDLLAAQIEQGVRPDLFASANLTLPAALHARGLVEQPVAFASNRLVLAVPSGATKVRSVDGLLAPGVTLAIGSPTVPIGAYTRLVLARLGPTAARIMSHVRSQEPDVGGIVGKLTQGAVDAGFVYVSDVKAARGALQAIDLPARVQPQVTYGVAVVKGSSQALRARQFIAGLLSGAGQRALRAAGFGPPPR